MRLFVVIGYADAKPSSPPFPVYVGTSGADKIHAMNRSTAARFVVLDNPQGLRKNNPHAESNRLREQYQAPLPGVPVAAKSRR